MRVDLEAQQPAWAQRPVELRGECGGQPRPDRFEVGKRARDQENGIDGRRRQAKLHHVADDELDAIAPLVLGPASRKGDPGPGEVDSEGTPQDAASGELDQQTTVTTSDLEDPAVGRKSFDQKISLRSRTVEECRAIPLESD